jgi:DnaJ-class molecular chaperone
MTYRDLNLAREIFGLNERVTLQELKNRQRELVKRLHPDAGNADEPEQIRKVNAAYQVLQEYIGQYSYSFTEEEFYEQNPEEGLRRQFLDDQLWSNG